MAENYVLEDMVSQVKAVKALDKIVEASKSALYQTMNAYVEAKKSDVSSLGSKTMVAYNAVMEKLDGQIISLEGLQKTANNLSVEVRESFNPYLIQITNQA